MVWEVLVFFPKPENCFNAELKTPISASSF